MNNHQHEHYMSRCLELASQGLGHVAPNPMVGSVIVHNDHIIAEGYHEKYSGPHAERNALQNISQPSLLSESTLYVNLEPCSHHGKTPPCADAILEAKIPHVVVGITDPNPLVSGSGIQRLREYGVNVTEGVLEKESKELNRRFLTYQTKKRPYIILKWAETSDRFLGPLDGQRVPISCKESQLLSHKWRTQEAAILVGTNTAELDNPQLTARLATGNNPLRIVLDRSARLSQNLALFDGSTPTLVVTERERSSLQGVETLSLPFNSSLLPQLLTHLYEMNIASLIVEGGGYTLEQFVEQDLWDEARIFRSSSELGEGTRAPLLSTKLLTSSTSSGTDTLAHFRNKL